jgi:hypothetical protein
MPCTVYSVQKHAANVTIVWGPSPIKSGRPTHICRSCILQKRSQSLPCSALHRGHAQGHTHSQSSIGSYDIPAGGLCAAVLHCYTPCRFDAITCLPAPRLGAGAHNL